MGSAKAMRQDAQQAGPMRSADRERIIADALVDVASELRLIDAAELILMIRNDHAANIADVVNSSTELFFKSGTMRYALSANYRAPWDATPVVAIDMEFRHGMVSRLLPPHDRRAPSRGGDHRHPVRRAGTG